MSRVKQIEEMITAIDDVQSGGWKFASDGIYTIDTYNAELAEALYEAGYRKQSEGEWKQTEEPMGWHDVDCVECSACGESWVIDDNIDYDLIVEYWHYCPNCGAKMKGGAE